MRKALVLFALVASFVAAGCASSGGGCDGISGCGSSCPPKQECCWTWQPDCCNNWDWYVPCDLIEGREYRQGGPCESVPSCAPCK